jgi:hypothetical protein
MSMQAADMKQQSKKKKLIGQSQTGIHANQCSPF